ncbi:MAG: DUF5076 domain-containing protein [Brevundimonas sp.]|nr:DUF5076 domain-containing protein [Brevundimonas sp.]
MSVETKALPIPDPALQHGNLDEVIELIRVWWVGERPQAIIRPAPKDPKLAGAILAELAYNFSRAYEANVGLDREEAFQQILNGWEEAHRLAAGGGQGETA